MNVLLFFKGEEFLEDRAELAETARFEGCRRGEALLGLRGDCDPLEGDHFRDI